MTRQKQENKLEQYFIPDVISFCHFSFENVIWKPQKKSSIFNKFLQTSSYDRLFQIVKQIKKKMNNRLMKKKCIFQLILLLFQVNLMI